MKRLLATVAGLVFLLVFGTAVSAGPAQEKEQEAGEKKETQKKYTNDDLKKWPSSSSSGSEGRPAVPEGEDADAGNVEADPGQPEADPWDSVGVAIDSEGRGEAYWRQTMTEARAALANAKKEHDRLQGEMDRNQVDFTAIDDPAARALVHTRIEELFTELSLAEQTLENAEAALRDLEEEARKSGALPGWLR